MDLTTTAANKIYRHEYTDAIDELKTLLNKIPSGNITELAMTHINLAMAYGNLAKDNVDFIELRNIHYKEAFKYGHNTGIVADRLIIDLTKAYKFKNAVQVCELILNDAYQCGKHAFRKKDYFTDKISKLLLKMERHKGRDTSTDKLFSDAEIKMTIENSTRFNV